MGKMRMGQDPRNKSKLGQGLIKGLKEAVQAEQAPVILGISEDRLQEAMQSVLDTHSDLFKRLAEVEAQESLVLPPPIAATSCQCSPPPAMPKMIDKRARQYGRLLKKEMLEDRKELDGLLSMYVQSIDRKSDQLENALVDLRDLIMNEKPEEIQVVKETIIEKPVTDKRVWLAIGASMLLNLVLILLK